MSNKTECPVCGSYSSTITAGIQNEGKCPICGTSELAILQLEEIESKIKYYSSKKLEEKVVKENEELTKELIIKRERYQHLKDIVWSMYYHLEKLTKDLEDEYINRMKDW